MAAVLKHWREAATLMIVAPRCLQATTKFLDQSDPSGDRIVVAGKNKKLYESDYDAVLVKRSTKSKFMPNVYVFPGGTAENNDFSSEWISVFQKIGKDFQQSMFDKVSQGSSKAAPMFTRQRVQQFSAMPPEVAFRICAIRETFEESGILIAKRVDEFISQKHSLLSNRWNASSSLSNNELCEWRNRVNENPDNFLKMCKELDLVPDILSLYEWTNWLTPTKMAAGESKRRFDTIFYICCLDHKPEATEDSIETVDLQWVSPPSLLSSYFKGHGVGLAPPQIYELSRLLNFRTAAELMEFSADRESQRVERWLPVVIFCDDAIISLLPGDDLYPENVESHLTETTMIVHNVSMEELNRNVKNFHRLVNIKIAGSKGQPFNVFNNIVFENKHVGPVSNLLNEFVTQGKL